MKVNDVHDTEESSVLFREPNTQTLRRANANVRVYDLQQGFVWLVDLNDKMG